jgi:hypothetical protein
MKRILKEMSGPKRGEVGEGFIMSFTICIVHKMLLR